MWGVSLSLPLLAILELRHPRVARPFWYNCAGIAYTGFGGRPCNLTSSHTFALVTPASFTKRAVFVSCVVVPRKLGRLRAGGWPTFQKCHHSPMCPCDSPCVACPRAFIACLGALLVFFLGYCPLVLWLAATFYFLVRVRSRSASVAVRCKQCLATLRPRRAG